VTQQAANPLRITAANDIDPAILAEIRVDAMRPSLEAVGRFDPARARDRFLARYDPAETQLIHFGARLAGFFVVRRRSDHHYLDHLYICPGHQGGGLGRQVVQVIQQTATEAALPIKLMALKGSPSNAFYLSCGFVLLATDEFDNHYIWDHSAQDAVG